MEGSSQFTRLCAEIQARALGKSRFLLGIDGPGGCGKSTLARALARTLPAAAIICTDDFYRPDLGMADHDRLLAQVFRPFQANRLARYQRYDWDRDALAEWHDVSPAGIVMVEGVMAIHPDFNAFYDYRVWVACPPEVGFQRGLARDLSEYGVDTRQQWLNIWLPQERDYVQTHRPWEQADFIFQTG